MAPADDDITRQLLTFIAGLIALPADATEKEKVALAKRVGMRPALAAVILNKTEAAAKKALERARPDRRG